MLTPGVACRSLAKTHLTFDYHPLPDVEYGTRACVLSSPAP